MDLGQRVQMEEMMSRGSSHALNASKPEVQLREKCFSSPPRCPCARRMEPLLPMSAR